MIDNELESTESEVSSESSSETPSSPEKSSGSSEGKSAAPQEKYVPYERFQEVIQLKNEFAKRLEDHEKRYQDLEARLSRPKEEPKPKAENPLLGRLKTVDPEFGSWAEKMEASQAELQELRQWRVQADQERIRNEAQSELNRLHSEYKIPDDLKDHYGMYIKQAVSNIESTGRLLSVKDLKDVYKTVHENINKVFEAQKRATIANYTAAKKVDVAPTVKKGTASKPANQAKPKFSNDREEAKAQIVKQAMEQVRANKAALN